VVKGFYRSYEGELVIDESLWAAAKSGSFWVRRDDLLQCRASTLVHAGSASHPHERPRGYSPADGFFDEWPW